MKRALFVAALVGLSLCLARPARGQTVTPGTPSPSPSPTVSPYPEPVPLLQQSAAALRHAGAYHMSEVYEISNQGTSIIRVTAVGDVDLKNRAERLTVVASAGGQAVTVAMIEVKHRAWIKRASTGNVWKRVKLAQVRTLEGFINDPLQMPNAPYWQIPGWINLGPDRLRGAPVWRLHDDSTGILVTLDFSIGQNNDLPYAMSFAEPTIPDGMAVDRYDLSRFGKQVTIRPPQG